VVNSTDGVSGNQGEEGYRSYQALQASHDCSAFYFKTPVPKLKLAKMAQQSLSPRSGNNLNNQLLKFFPPALRRRYQCDFGITGCVIKLSVIGQRGRRMSACLQRKKAVKGCAALRSVRRPDCLFAGSVADFWQNTRNLIALPS